MFTKIRNKTRMSTPATLIQNSFGSPSYGNQRTKREKRNPNWKEVKLSLLADDLKEKLWKQSHLSLQQKE